MNIYEYQVVSSESQQKSAEEAFNFLGAEGWILNDVQFEKMNPEKFIACFRRLKRSESPATPLVVAGDLVGQIVSVCKRRESNGHYYGRLDYIARQIETPVDQLKARLEEMGIRATPLGQEKPTFNRHQSYSIWITSTPQGDCWFNAAVFQPRE